MCLLVSAIECGNIPTIENADRITSLPPLTTTADYNDVLDYRCRDGYESSARRDARERVDIITLVCRADGIWEPNPLPTCVRKSILRVWNAVKQGYSKGYKPVKHPKSSRKGI